MRVVLSTIGKFHSFDLAREMHKRGALETIYSGYPWFKLKSERLPRNLVHTFPYIHAPYMRLAPRYIPARMFWEWQDRVWFDRYVAGCLEECDVFCALSGSGLHSGQRAKARGAKYVCDRGSAHIRAQDEILREEFDLLGVPYAGVDPRIIEREEAEYAAADVITVPSTFAYRTFVQYRISEEKLRVASYGVDLGTFHPSGIRSPDEFRVLFVGALSVRKGVRYLLEGFDRLECVNKRLSFAGWALPEMEEYLGRYRGRRDIEFLGHVPHEQLRQLMSTSHVLVLPSVEDGLGLVQLQAMACGCPVIASENTGALDVFTDGTEGFIVPIRDPAAIADRLQILADNPQLWTSMSHAALERVKSIQGWEEYGKRMHEIFSEAA